MQPTNPKSRGKVEGWDLLVPVVLSPVAIVGALVFVWLALFVGSIVGDAEPPGDACTFYTDGGSTTATGSESVGWGLIPTRRCEGPSGSGSRLVAAGGFSGIIVAVAAGWGVWAWVSWALLRKKWGYA